MLSQTQEDLKILCYNCQHELDLELNQKVSRIEECIKCYSDIRCCNMCELFSANSYNQCREPGAQRVVHKEKANFCDYFQLKKMTNKVKSTDSILEDANSLFKN